MMALFDIRELIKMAVRDEETGVAFYKALAERTKLPHAQSQVIAISKQEELHAERFRNMLRSLGDYTPSEQYGGQYAEYLHALLNTRAFPSPSDAAVAAREVRGDAEALEIALRLEKDTLNFYGAVRNLLSPVHGEMVEAIMDEERGHLVELSKLKTVVVAG